MSRAATALALFLAATTGLAAQRPAPAAPEPGADLTIAVYTMGVGAEVWERFGHNAIVVEDHTRGTSTAYNYGMFSFRQEHFILRFLQGRMLYWMAGYPTDDDIPRYFAMGRSVWRQELDLTPAQRAALRDQLEWNARDENKFYRYDYYRDNCSTRVRDALDKVLGGAIERQMRLPGETYRFHTQRLNSHNPLLYTGLMLALGPFTDAPRTRWDEMFLPLKLHEYLRQVRLPDADGGYKPLVSREVEIFHSDAYPVREDPPHWMGYYLVLGLLLGGLLLGAGKRYGRTGQGRRWFTVPAVTVSLLSGIAGAILAGLWAFTDHLAAARNQNVLQVTLVALALGLVLPWAGPARPGAVRAARALAWLVGGLSVFGLLLKLLPVWQQVNGQILALTVPLDLGLMLGVLAAFPPPAPRA